MKWLKVIRSSLTAEGWSIVPDPLYALMNPLPSQIRDRKETPRRALLYLLSQRAEWHLSQDVVKELAEAATPPEIEHYLPSERKYGQDVTLKGVLTSPKGSTESCIQVLSQDCVSLTLRWPFTAPKYKGEFDTYIWQPFRRPPPFAYVKIFISNRETPRNLRILLLFQNAGSDRSFRASYAETQHLGDRATWAPALDGGRAIIVAFKNALEDTSRFLRQASEQIMALVRSLNLTLTIHQILTNPKFVQTFASRINPSKQKVLYLVHLKDGFKRIPLDMQRNLAQLREVAESMHASMPEGTPFVEDQILDDFERDADYVLDELRKLECETNDLIREVTGPELLYLWTFPRLDYLHTDVTQIELQRRFDSSNTLTFLALLYVPLSFVTVSVSSRGFCPLC